MKQLYRDLSFYCVELFGSYDFQGDYVDKNKSFDILMNFGFSFDDPENFSGSAKMVLFAGADKTSQITNSCSKISLKINCCFKLER